MLTVLVPIQNQLQLVDSFSCIRCLECPLVDVVLKETNVQEPFLKLLAVDLQSGGNLDFSLADVVEDEFFVVHLATACWLFDFFHVVVLGGLANALIFHAIMGEGRSGMRLHDDGSMMMAE
jgi:hypothetical protein